MFIIYKETLSERDREREGPWRTPELYSAVCFDNVVRFVLFVCLTELCFQEVSETKQTLSNIKSSIYLIVMHIYGSYVFI